MKLYLSMLYYQLGKCHRVDYNHSKFLDKSALKLPMYLTNGPLSTDCVYIAKAEEINPCILERSNLNIICLGKSSVLLENRRYEIIAVESDDSSYDVHDLHNEVAMIFHMYQEWEEALVKLVHGSQNLLEIFRISESVLENPCVLIDHNFTFLGYTSNFFNSSIVSDQRDHSSVPLNYVNDFRLDVEFKKLTHKKGVFTFCEYPELGNMLCHNITYRHRYFARLITHDIYHPLCKADEWHLSILAQHIQMIFDSRTDLLVFPDRAGKMHKLIRTLAIENRLVSDMDIDRILEKTEWRRNDPYRVIYLKLLVSSGVDVNITYLCSKIEQLWKGSCTFQADDGILWVLNLRQYMDSHDFSFYDTLGFFLRESLCQAGISNVYSDISQTSLFFQQAKIALQIGGQNRPTHWYHNFEDHALSYMLSQCTQQFPAEELCHPAVLRLRQHDKEKHTEYFGTLKVYLEHKFSIIEAADALFIHRTTLINRLKNIQKLIPLDLDNPQIIQHLMLSFALLDENL